MIITLGILAILALMAVAFALSARTELKSASSYSDLISAKSLAKMGADRCLMEIIAQNNPAPLSGYNAAYPSNNCTQLDNWTNDTFSPYFGGTSNNQADFLNLDDVSTRSQIEPYWIGVRDANGKLIGRFAYYGRGNLVDISAIGNILGPGETHVRTNGIFGVGYIGNTGSNYTRGICSDVSLQAFLAKLGYSDPTNSARLILWTKYGRRPGLDPTNAPGTYTYLPGDNGVDNNADGITNNPSEYDPIVPRGTGPGVMDIGMGNWTDLLALDNPWNGGSYAAIAPDPAHSNLADYATVGSSESNLTNLYGYTRVNLNAMVGTTNCWATLTNLLKAAQIPNPEQVAVNLIDFHTTNMYPTVVNNGLKTFIGIKPTPYINRITYWFTVSCTRDVAVTTNWTVIVSVMMRDHIWNPYPGSFPDQVALVASNIFVMNYTNANGTLLYGTFTTTNNSLAATSLHGSPVGTGYTQSGWTDIGTIAEFSFQATNAETPPSFVISNMFVSATLSSAGNPSNLINWIITPQATNYTIDPTGPYASGPQSIILYQKFMQLEADDPRMNILYSQSRPGGMANTNTCYPVSSNVFTRFPDTGPREGLGSLYIKTNDYVTIGEVGAVHRGEPWATLRLSSDPAYPNAPHDGKLLDFVRVNDLDEVRGRINLNSDTDGPLGQYQSPAFYALFSGLTNSFYGTVTDAKIDGIIRDIYGYRSTVLRGGEFGAIGQVCSLPTLSSDLANNQIGWTNDFVREELVREISNLITVNRGGTADILAFGQTIRGGNIAGPIVVLRMKYSPASAPGQRITVTRFQYLPR